MFNTPLLHVFSIDSTIISTLLALRHTLIVTSSLFAVEEVTASTRSMVDVWLFYDVWPGLSKHFRRIVVGA